MIERDPNEVTDSANNEAPGYQPPTTEKKTYNPFDRTQFRDTWMSQGGNYGGDVNKFISDQNLDPSQFSQAGKDNGAWRLPTGEVLDLVMDKGGANKAAWTGAGSQATPGEAITPDGPPASSQPGAMGAPLAAISGAASQDPAAAAASAAKASQDAAMRKQLVDQLMGRATQSLAVDRNDPVIRAQADAYSANEERAKRNYLSDIAERSGPYSTGNVRNEQRMANEGVGQRTGAMESGLMAQQLNSKRAEIAQALESERGLLSADDQLALQKELAQMDDAIRRLSLQQNSTQFGQNLGLNYAQLAQNQDQFGRSLGTQNDQFLANFGLASTNQASYWDAVRNGLL